MPPTTSHSVGFPVYAIGFGAQTGSPKVEDGSAPSHKWQLIIGGGGGNSKTGVRNKLILYELDVATRGIEQKAEHLFEKDEDAPWTLAVHPDVRAEEVCACDADRTDG